MANPNIIPKTDALQLLWSDTATISEYESVTNPETFETISELVPKYVDEPCRLSFKNEKVVSETDSEPITVQTIVLFIRPDIPIKAGSVIEITRQGNTNKYKLSSEPSIYTNHQEIMLALDKDV